MIRKARPADCQDIQRILSQAHKKNAELGFVFPVSRFSRRQLLSKMKRDRYYVLIYNGEAAGTVAVKRRKNYWEIGSLAVLPKYQGNGLGPQLLQFAEKKIRRLGGKKAVGFTPKNHPVLPPYYRKLGYRPGKTVVFNNIRWVRLTKRL